VAEGDKVAENTKKVVKTRKSWRKAADRELDGVNPIQEKADQPPAATQLPFNHDGSSTSTAAEAVPQLL
jgi:hypothetical protein